MYENRQVREVGQLLKCDMEKGLSSMGKMR